MSKREKASSEKETVFFREQTCTHTRQKLADQKAPQKSLNAENGNQKKKESDTQRETNEIVKKDGRRFAKPV